MGGGGINDLDPLAEAHMSYDPDELDDEEQDERIVVPWFVEKSMIQNLCKFFWGRNVSGLNF